MKDEALSQQIIRSTPTFLSHIFSHSEDWLLYKLHLKQDLLRGYLLLLNACVESMLPVALCGC